MNRRIKKKKLKKAARLVLSELQKVSIFRGEYDAENGNDIFMDGVWTVIEEIGYMGGEKYGTEITSTFLRNVLTSEEVKIVE